MSPGQVFQFGLLWLGAGCLIWLARATGKETDNPYTVMHRKAIKPALLIGLVLTVAGGIWTLVT